MHEKLNKVRQQNPNFDKELVDSFAKTMPNLLNILIDGCLYDFHIGSKDTALMAEEFIKNSKDEKIGFYFDYDDVLNYTKRKVNLNETEYYPSDIWTWANVKYGDMIDILKGLDKDQKEQIILDYALAELNDPDFPFYSASSRPYFWLKKNIENHESNQ